MISSLYGKIELKEDKFLVLDVNGVGYKVFCSEKTLESLPEMGEEFKIFTSLVVKDDALDLYGFLSLNKLYLFERLLTISGVGPRAALHLAEFESLEELKKTLASGKKIVSGIGPKKVQKILLELGEMIQVKSEERRAKSEKDDEVEALVSLGIPKSRAKEVVSEIPEEIEGTENIVKEALKRLGK